MICNNHSHRLRAYYGFTAFVDFGIPDASRLSPPLMLLRWLLSCFQISKESPTRRYQLHMVFFTGKICQDRRWWKQWSKSGNEGLWLSNCHDLFLLHNNYFFLFFFSRQVLLVTAKDNMTILQKYMWYTQKVGKLIIDWIIICLMAI